MDRLWRGDDPANAWVLPVAIALILAQLASAPGRPFSSYWEGDDYHCSSQALRARRDARSTC